MMESIDIRQYRFQEIREKPDWVVTERLVSLVVNQKRHIRIAMSPSFYREFVYGYLLTSNAISCKEDVAEVTITGEKIEVTLPGDHDPGEMLKGASGGFVPDFKENGSRLNPASIPDFDVLIALFQQFNQMSTVFSQTGGSHSAALSDIQGIRYQAEDIGRHNAIDKVVGQALLNEEDFSKFYLMTSGRISSEIVRKAFHAGISGIISCSAPTSLAIQKAEEAGLTLIGFLRDKRFNLYTLLESGV